MIPYDDYMLQQGEDELLKKMDPQDQMADCFTSFDEFRKAHPEFHEMHFLTNQTVWDKDLEEEGE
jgi:hypothetical protein